jgi:hypothetical protein
MKGAVCVWECRGNGVFIFLHSEMIELDLKDSNPSWILHPLLDSITIEAIQSGVKTAVLSKFNFLFEEPNVIGLQFL